MPGRTGIDYQIRREKLEKLRENRLPLEKWDDVQIVALECVHVELLRTPRNEEETKSFIAKAEDRLARLGCYFIEPEEYRERICDIIDQAH